MFFKIYEITAITPFVCILNEINLYMIIYSLYFPLFINTILDFLFSLYFIKKNTIIACVVSVLVFFHTNVRERNDKQKHAKFDTALLI